MADAIQLFGLLTTNELDQFLAKLGQTAATTTLSLELMKLEAIRQILADPNLTPEQKNALVGALLNEPFVSVFEYEAEAAVTQAKVDSTDILAQITIPDMLQLGFRFFTATQVQAAGIARLRLVFATASQNTRLADFITAGATLGDITALIGALGRIVLTIPALPTPGQQIRVIPEPMNDPNNPDINFGKVFEAPASKANGVSVINLSSDFPLQVLAVALETGTVGAFSIGTGAAPKTLNRNESYSFSVSTSPPPGATGTVFVSQLVIISSDPTTPELRLNLRVESAGPAPRMGTGGIG